MTDIQRMADIITLQEDVIHRIKAELKDLQRAKYTVAQVIQRRNNENIILRIEQIIPNVSGMIVYVS